MTLLFVVVLLVVYQVSLMGIFAYNYRPSRYPEGTHPGWLFYVSRTLWSPTIVLIFVLVYFLCYTGGYLAGLVDRLGWDIGSLFARGARHAARDAYLHWHNEVP
jgi:hypothetical protein